MNETEFLKALAKCPYKWRIDKTDWGQRIRARTEEGNVCPITAVNYIKNKKFRIESDYYWAGKDLDLDKNMALDIVFSADYSEWGQRKEERSRLRKLLLKATKLNKKGRDGDE